MPIAIASKRGDVVAKEDWEAIQETLYLTSIPGMAESIIAAANTPIEECIPLEDLICGLRIVLSKQVVRMLENCSRLER